MQRRAFISMLAGAAGALALPKWRIPDPTIILAPGAVNYETVALGYTVTYEELADNLYSYGLAPLKAEGSLLLFDKWKQIIRPSLETAWNEHYADHVDVLE